MEPRDLSSPATDLLIADVFHLIVYFLGDTLFPLNVASYPGKDDGSEITVACTTRDGRRWHLEPDEIWQWGTITVRSFKRDGSSYSSPTNIVQEMYRARKSALGAVAAAGAVCRQWAAWLLPLWPRFHAEFEKCMPFILSAAKEAKALELLSPPPTERTDRSSEWYRLAVKCFVRRGRKLAHQIVKFVDVKPGHRAASDRPNEVFIYRDQVTGERSLKRVRHRDHTRDIPEKRVVEKSIDGHLYWRSANIGDFDAAVKRRERVEEDTKELLARLRRDARKTQKKKAE